MMVAVVWCGGDGVGVGYSVGGGEHKVTRN